MPRGAELVGGLAEGARAEIVRVEFAAALLLRLTVEGEKLHEIPAGVP